MEKEYININDESFGEKYLCVDKVTGQIIWKDVSTITEKDDGVLRYIREDIFEDKLHKIENQLAQSQNEVDRLNMRIYTRC